MAKDLLGDELTPETTATPMDAPFQAPKTYREMSVPFDSIDDCNKSFEAFQKELYDLRVKYRVRDLVYIAMLAVKYEDGEEGTPICVGMFGDQNLGESMSAFAYGRMAAERQERIAKELDRSMKSIKVPKTRK